MIIMIMRKISLLVLVVIVSLFLIVSCGEDNGNDTDANHTNSQTNTPDQTDDATPVGGETETNTPETTPPPVPADKVETFKINGIDLSKYIIFALDEIEEGEILAEKIGETLGINIRVESGFALPEGDKWIILDRQSYAYHDYSMKFEGGNLYIRGSYSSFPKALEGFELYLTGARGANVNITSASNFEGKLDTVKPMFSSKEELLAIYEYVTDSNHTLYGEHLGGGFDSIAEMRANILKKVGDEPAIFDHDMVGFYLGSFSRSMISRIICEALDFTAEGGIITTSCHWQNPNEITRADTIYRGSIGSKELWTSVLTEGTEFNKRWKAQLDFNAEIYQAYKDLGLAVTFRPMHEANSGNMWWSYYHKECMLTGDDLRDMWNYVYDYYVNDLKLDNILWTYSPNNYTGEDTYTTMYYPGDDKCDIVGMDWYINSWESRNLADGYGYQDLLAIGKPIGLCEWGLEGSLQSPNYGAISENFSSKELVDIINTAKGAGLKITFLSVYMGRFGSVTRMPDGYVLNETPGIILLDDMPDIIRNALG